MSLQSLVCTLVTLVGFISLRVGLHSVLGVNKRV